MTIEIEKGIEIPSSKTRPNGPADLLRKLEVGDSFLYPLEKRESINSMSLRLKPHKFITRKIDDIRIRVWRVE